MRVACARPSNDTGSILRCSSPPVLLTCGTSRPNSYPVNYPERYGNHTESGENIASTRDTPPIAVNKYDVPADNDGPHREHEMDASVHFLILLFLVPITTQCASVISPPCPAEMVGPPGVGLLPRPSPPSPAPPASGRNDTSPHKRHRAVSCDTVICPHLPDCSRALTETNSISLLKLPRSFMSPASFALRHLLRWARRFELRACVSQASVS